MEKSIVFSPSFEQHSFVLLELDEHLLTELGFDSKGNWLSAHEKPRVTLRGSADDDAYLCTSTRTYAVKEAVVSNSIMLLNSQDSNAMVLDGDNNSCLYVKDNLGSYLELTVTSPKTDKLALLLHQNPYAGPEEENASANLYTFDDLREQISASDSELLQALNKLEALELQGFYRTLKFEYMNDLMESAIEICKGHNWTFLALPEKGFLRSIAKLESFPSAVVLHCLKLWSDHPPKDNGTGELWWRLSELKVCRFLGINLLRIKQNLDLKDFMEAWTKICPEEVQSFVNEDTLQGFALKRITPVGSEYLTYYPHTDLPSDPRARFATLFQERPKWTGHDLIPFINDLAVDPKQRDALLLKHTRVSTVRDKSGNESKVYSSRF